MTMAKTTATAYISNQTQWKEGLMLLRELILSTDLKETIKWGVPVYTLDGKNVVGIGSFKSYFGLWFFNGSFLKDDHNLLTAQEGTKGLRSFRFTSGEEIDPKIVLAYVEEAVQNEKAGKRIKPEKKKLVIPDELQSWLSSRPELNEAFKELTPGKRREYAEYIDEAKREATKVSRLEKITPMILEKKGLHDKYKK